MSRSLRRWGVGSSRVRMAWGRSTNSENLWGSGGRFGRSPGSGNLGRVGTFDRAQPLGWFEPIGGLGELWRLGGGQPAGLEASLPTLGHAVAI